jgi:ABC-type oligopeptide transport system substrate-binding subunit
LLYHYSPFAPNWQRKTAHSASKSPVNSQKGNCFFCYFLLHLSLQSVFCRFCAKMNGMRLFFLKRWLRFTAAVLAAAFLFALTGCGSSTNSASFTWFVDSIPANLDPQVASGASDVIACENLYGTLVRKDPDGELVPGLCEKWTVSPDGLTYTFTLKDGLHYAAAKGAATEYDITAEDFVFAFRRIFRADTASPYAVEFSAIQNSAAVQAGLADESSLGVSANGALTLVFRLSERDDNFLAKLALPGAAPCDEAFFESTRGTYGLTAKTTLASGSFYLYNWTTNGLFLRRTVESPLVGSLRLVQDTSGSGKSAAQLIADGKCSAALDESGEATNLQTVNYSDTTWALLFNAAEGSVFQNQQLRQALAGIARENATVPSGGLYAAAKGLVPEGLTVDGLDYRDAAGDPLPTISEPKALYLAARQGMATSDFSGVTLLLPKGAGLTELADQINSAWQKECSLFFSVEEVEQDEFDARIAAGKYTIALAPIRAEGGSVYQMLQQFTTAGGSLTGYADTVYADRLALSAQQTGKARCALLAQCERQLLESCTVVPLMAQQKRLLLANGVRDLVFDPFFPVLDLTWAKMS